MDDLVFKNIPVEGFDPQSGFSDRVSNPTPSRSGAVAEVPRMKYLYLSLTVGFQILLLDQEITT